MASPRSLFRFRTLRANLRSALFCALLLLGHVLITTMSAIAYSSHTSTDLSPILDPLSRTIIPRLSGLIFITLLWQGFILFEQADARAEEGMKRDEWALRGAQGEKTSLLGRKRRDEKEDEDEDGAVVFSSTILEIVLGLAVAALWIVMLPSVVQLCTIFYPRLAKDLIVLYPLFGIIYTSTIALNLQILVELVRRAARRDLTGRWWMMPVGAWAGRVQLHEEA